ncbi:MAG: hypothetical protein CXZ00_09325 [Acidobacteria bacterium]|nr:MAG: hypothetical protein CXZ00_09325 [Acidobacteriota bacterium]
MDTASWRLRYHMATHIPAVLVISAALLAILHNDTFFLIGAVIGSGIASYVFYNIIFYPENLRLGWVLGTGLLLGYAFGTLNTIVQLLFRGDTPESRFGLSVADLSIALAAVLLVAALLFVVSSLIEPPLLGEPFQVGQQQLRLIWTGLGIVFLAFVSGDLGYMGLQASDEHRITVLGSIGAIVAPILPAVTLLALSNAQVFRQKVTLWIALAMEVIFLLPQGRRVLMYAMVVGFMAYNFNRLRLRRQSSARPSLTKRLLILFAGALIAYGSIVSFFALRYATMQMGKGRSLTEYAGRAVTLLQDGDPMMARQLASNVQDRTFILTYLSELLSASWHTTPMLGEDAAFCIKSSIPSVLYPDKHAVNEIGAEEVIANPHFGLMVRDEANSLLTAGVSDFGLAGAIAYPFAILGFYVCFSRVVGRYLPPMTRLFLNFALVYGLIQAETVLTSNINICRDLLIFIFVFALIDKIPSLRVLRRRTVHAHSPGI